MVSREVLFPDIHSEQVTDRVSLGGGCYGKVYKANYNPIGRVAVKYALRHADEEELRKEFDFLVRHGTSHPNIVHVFGLIEDDEGVGLVMEFCPGGTLDGIIRNRKDLIYTVENVIHWSLQISSAIAHMHSIGTIHRDLKPQNVLLDRSYTHLKLCDFGFARMVDPSMTVRTGSWFWMAPEVMTSSKYDFKCDVFGIGVIMWQLVAREYPYQELMKLNVTDLEYIQKICVEGHRPKDLNCIQELDILMKWCWDHLDDRISAEDLRDQLAETLRVFDHDRNPPMAVISDKLLPPIGCFDGAVHESISSDEDEDVDVTEMRKLTLKSMRSFRSENPVAFDAPPLDGASNEGVNDIMNSQLSWSVTSSEPATVRSVDSLPDNVEDDDEPLPPPPPSATLTPTTRPVSLFDSYHFKTLENLDYLQSDVVGNTCGEPANDEKEGEKGERESVDVDLISFDNSNDAIPTSKLISTGDSAGVSNTVNYANTSRRSEELSSSRGSSVYESTNSTPTQECSSFDLIRPPSLLDLDSSVHSRSSDDRHRSLRFASQVNLYSPAVYSTEDSSRAQTPNQDPLLTSTVGHNSDQERIAEVLNEAYTSSEASEERDVVGEHFAPSLNQDSYREKARRMDSCRLERSNRTSSGVEHRGKPPHLPVKRPTQAPLVDHSDLPENGENAIPRWVRSRKTTSRNVRDLRGQFEKQLHMRAPEK